MESALLVTRLEIVKNPSDAECAVRKFTTPDPVGMEPYVYDPELEARINEKLSKYLSAAAAAPSIPEFFAGRTVFMTGASGFMGKVLMEKLLRTCPDIAKIMVLVRPKRGREPRERVRELLDGPLFEKLKSTYPKATSKVEALAGDVTSLNLGLSPSDRARVTSQASIIFHVAASVRFDDPLRSAVLLNTRGAREVVQLAKDLNKLTVLVHVSTTYCNTDRELIEECVYPAVADWRTVVALAEDQSNNELETNPEKFTGYHPNTYTFSKSLAEQVVNEASHEIPAVIFRPSIVIGTWKEPIPGWVDNLNGPLALCVGVSKGLLRTTLAQEESVMDFIVADVAINGIIASAWRKGVGADSGELEVYNGCASQRKTFTVRQIMEMGLKSIERCPHDRILWYPMVILTKRVWLYAILSLFLHFIPGLLIDGLLRLTGNKPWEHCGQPKCMESACIVTVTNDRCEIDVGNEQTIKTWKMTRTYLKAFRASLALQYFTINHWLFDNVNFLVLDRVMKREDHKTFKIDVAEDINVAEYLHDSVQGVRRYVLKEEMDPVRARRNQTMMYYLDRAVRAVMVYFVLKWVYQLAVGHV